MNYHHEEETKITMQSKSDSDELQLKVWREEQFRIATNAVIPKSKCHISPTKPNSRYEFANIPINGPLLVGGVDVSFQEEGDEAIAVYVILQYETIDSPPQVVCRSHKWYTLQIPYIPSYLAFREIDPLVELISSQIAEKPQLKPNVIFVDGNGQWHERRAGIATFLGVKTGIPTVGIGKTFYSIDGVMDKKEVHMDVNRAISSWYNEMIVKDDGTKIISETSKARHLLLDTTAIPTLSNTEADTSKDVSMEEMLTALHSIASGLAIPMKSGQNINNNEVLAYALVGHAGNTPTNKQKNATKDNNTRRGSKNPIYISVGSNISLEDAVTLCSHLCIARIPEPVREADLYGRQLVREKQMGG